jgi:hypothetical protein
MNTLKDTIINIVIIILILLVGIFIGSRSSFKEIKSEIRYLPSDTIRDTIVTQVLVKEVIPSKPIYLVDTLIINDTIIQVIDTSAIINDWITQRFYKDTLINSDTLGLLVLESEIQYNKLQNLNYEYSPIQKEINTTVTKVKWVEPYVMVGYGTNNNANFQVGLFIKQHFGISYQGLIELTNQPRYFHVINVGYKF